MSLTFPIQRRSLAPPFPARYAEVFGEAFTGIPLIRVMGSFKAREGQWIQPATLLLDTGASISLLPDELGDELGITTYFEHNFFGVVQREECKVPAKMARIQMRLVDQQGHKSPEFTILAAFTSVRPVVPLIGMKDCIEHFITTLDFSVGEARMQFI